VKMKHPILLRLEWGRRNEKYRLLLWRLLSRPVHTIITAERRKVYGEKGQELPQWEPRWLTPTPHWADVVISMDKLDTNPPRYVSTLVKCRFKRDLSLRITDLSFNKLLKELRDKLGVVFKGVEYE